MKQERQIHLFVVRNGETEKESLARTYYAKQMKTWSTMRANQLSFKEAKLRNMIPKKPLVDTLDPMLTAAGYSQAAKTFQTLLPLVRERKVAIFCSPLRRDLGTALMIGSVVENRLVKWNMKVDEDEENIPITVMNELGDFVPEINSRGGSHKLTVPHRFFLQCAEIPANDGSMNSPLMRSIQSMHTHEAVLHKIGSKMAPDEEDVPKPVRLWKRSEGGTKLVPMSPPIFPLEKTDSSGLEFEPTVRGPYKANDQAPTTVDPIKAVDDALTMAASRGCDTCIIVSCDSCIHELIKVCGYFDNDDRTRVPYCGVGCFTVSLSDTKWLPQYNFFNYFSGDALHHDLMDHMLPPPKVGTSRLHLIHPVYSNHVLCAISSFFLDGHLSPQIWLQETKKIGRQAIMDFMGKKAKEYYLDFRITGGINRWKKFVEQVNRRGNELTGWVCWERPRGKQDQMFFVRAVYAKSSPRGDLVGLFATPC